MRRVLSFFRAVIGLVILVLLLIPVVGPPLYVEVAGVSAPAEIVAKREAIDILTDTWTRRLYLDVRYQPADASEPLITDIAVNAATYDGLRVGAPVEIRYAPNPTLRLFRNIAAARLESQPPFGSFVARLGALLIGFVIGIVAWLALLLAWTKWRRWWLALALIALMFGGVIYVGSGWPSPTPAGELVPGEAIVRATHRIDRVWGSRRRAAEEAVQPYTIVELSFVPAGAADSIVGVDMIDADSVPGMEKGAPVPIHYSAADPRWVRIDGANRTYYWKNLRSFGIIAAVLLALLLVGWVAHRRRTARRGRRAAP